MLRASEHEMRQLDDEYVSTEHLLLSLSGHNSKAGEILRAAGATHEHLDAAIREVRGPHRVTDAAPEDKYQALEKYGRDLTEAAALGAARPGDRARRPRSAASSRCCRAARRTTRC